MILAISRFRVANAKSLEVEQAFLDRPRLVDNVPGFLGLEVFTNTADPASFHLLTRWADVESFRRWHSSPAHNTSHQGIPKGLKLDPSQTELLFLERIGDESGPSGDSVLDWPEMISGFLEKSPSICYVVAGRCGTVRTASAGFLSALRLRLEELADASLFSFLAEGSRDLPATLGASGECHSNTEALAFCSPSGASFNLECRLDIQPQGFALIGCAREQRAETYMETLEDLNNRLAVEIRESARRGKELERVNVRLQHALDELDNMYWHLRKIQEVLPICLDCGKVKTGDGSWQTLVDYLKSNSQFLSHGYCPECYERTLAENA